MKNNFKLFTVFFLAFILFSNCKNKKKDEIIPVFNTDCYNGTFSVPTENNLPVLDLAMNKDNGTVALMQDGSDIVLQTNDSHGKQQSVIRTKFSNPAKLMNLLLTDDGGYLISAASFNFSDSIISFPSHYYFRSNNGAQLCYTNFFSYPYTKIIHRINKSNTYLYKLNSTGTIEWEKNFAGNYYNGVSICKNGTGYLLASLRNNLTFRTSATNDTIFNNFNDRNSLFIYSLDISGNTIWNHEFDNIVGLSEGSTEFYQASVRIKNNKILLQSGTNIFLLNMNSTIIQQKNISDVYCTYSNSQGIALNAIMNDNSVFVFFQSGPQSSPCVLVYDFNLNLINSFEASGNSLIAYLFSQLTEADDGTFYSYDGRSITNFNTSGFLFSKSTQSFGSSGVNCIIPNCGEGIIFDGIDLTNGNFSITKADRSGNF